MKRPAASPRAARKAALPKAKPAAAPARRGGAQPVKPVPLLVDGSHAGPAKPRSRRGGLSAAIYADLRQQLVSLQRLPDTAVSENEIARAYGCSRTPVREAVLKLADEGLLEIYPQSGIFVSRIPVAELPEAIVVRRALEGTTTRLAAAQATPSQVLALQAILQRQREADAADDRDAFHRADELFHATIAEVAGYPGIWTLIQQVKVHVDRYRRLTLPQPGRMARAIAEHEVIMAAIDARDPDGAVAAIDDHLDGLLADIAATRELNPDLFQARRRDRSGADGNGTAIRARTTAKTTAKSTAKTTAKTTAKASKPRGRPSTRR